MNSKIIVVIILALLYCTQAMIETFFIGATVFSATTFFSISYLMKSSSDNKVKELNAQKSYLEAQESYLKAEVNMIKEKWNIEREEKDQAQRLADSQIVAQKELILAKSSMYANMMALRVLGEDFEKLLEPSSNGSNYIPIDMGNSVDSSHNSVVPTSA